MQAGALYSITVEIQNVCMCTHHQQYGKVLTWQGKLTEEHHVPRSLEKTHTTRWVRFKAQQKLCLDHANHLLIRSALIPALFKSV